ADMLVIATDVDGVYTGWGTPDQRRLSRITPDELETMHFAAGSMGPKVEAACRFVRNTGRPASIGALGDIARIAAGQAGTHVAQSSKGSPPEERCCT
ncbi:MAG: carbamate kinase, partial [Mycolicibacterium sp.]